MGFRCGAGGVCFQRCQCTLFAWISDVPFQRGRAGDAPGASLGRDAFACASPAAFLRLPVPGNGRAPGGRGPYTGLCGGLPKARRCGALSPARPGRGCKVLPFGSLASLAPVVVRTYWCRRCHLGRVWGGLMLQIYNIQNTFVKYFCNYFYSYFLFGCG